MKNKKIDDLIDLLFKIRESPKIISYEIRDFLIDFINEFKIKDGFTLVDIAIIRETAQQVLVREKRRIKYYKQKKKIVIDESFFDWIKDQPKYMQNAEYRKGWISSKFLRDLYCRYKKEEISSKQFVKYLKDKYGEKIYHIKTYESKTYIGINLFKILERK